MWRAPVSRRYAARDPIGINSLYWGTGLDGSTWFASEAKPLVQAGCIDVAMFPPGHYYSSTSGDARKAGRAGQLVRYYKDVDHTSLARLANVLRAVLPMSGLLAEEKEKGGGAVEETEAEEKEADAADNSDEGAEQSQADLEGKKLYKYEDIFKITDTHGFGEIVFEEFIHILKIFQLHPKHMSETEALHLFARYDDGDGNVSFDEYMGMMERIEERYCLGVLVKIGWDMRKLMKGFVLAVLCLLLLFFFIDYMAFIP